MRNISQNYHEESRKLNSIILLLEYFYFFIFFFSKSLLQDALVINGENFKNSSSRNIRTLTISFSSYSFESPNKIFLQEDKHWMTEFCRSRAPLSQRVWRNNQVLNMKRHHGAGVSQWRNFVLVTGFPKPYRLSVSSPPINLPSFSPFHHTGFLAVPPVFQVGSCLRAFELALIPAVVPDSCLVHSPTSHRPWLKCRPFSKTFLGHLI